MFKSLAVDALLLEGGALIIGGASAAQINGIKNAIEGASKNIPLLGTIIATVGVSGTLLALKVFGGTWWANKVKSILPGWRP
jgi:hypothetical protein